MFKNRVRQKFTENFTIIPNSVLDGNLTHKAIGVLVYLLSRPENWKFNMNEIKTHFKMGIDAVRSALKELEAEKILIRYRSRNEGGKFGNMIYVLFPEERDFEEQKSNNDTNVGKSNVGNNNIGNSNTNNTEYNKTEYKKSKSLSETPIKTSGITISEIFKIISNGLEKLGMKNIGMQHAKFERILFDLKKGYSLEEIKEVIEYMINSKNEWMYKILSNPNALQNNFDSIKFEFNKKQKEIEEERKKENEIVDEFSNFAKFNGVAF